MVGILYMEGREGGRKEGRKGGEREQRKGRKEGKKGRERRRARSPSSLGRSEEAGGEAHPL